MAYLPFVFPVLLGPMKSTTTFTSTSYRSLRGLGHRTLTLQARVHRSWFPCGRRAQRQSRSDRPRWLRAAEDSGANGCTFSARATKAATPKGCNCDARPCACADASADSYADHRCLAGGFLAQQRNRSNFLPVQVEFLLFQSKNKSAIAGALELSFDHAPILQLDL